MSSRWTGFFVWALVAAAAAFWSLKIFAATRPVPPGAQAPQAVAANGPMERLFGAIVVAPVAANQPPPESSRFQLVGVIAPPADGSAGAGFAVVSLDGQPARTWRVGAGIDGSTTLLRVSKRGAEFGPAGGPAAFSLQLPEPAAAETGTLTAAVSQPDPSQMQQQQQPQQPKQPQPAGQQPPNFGNPGQGQMPPGLQGVPGRGGMQRGMGRGGFNGAPQNGVAPSRVATQPGTIEAPPLQQ